MDKETYETLDKMCDRFVELGKSFNYMCDTVQVLRTDIALLGEAMKDTIKLYDAQQERGESDGQGEVQSSDGEFCETDV